MRRRLKVLDPNYNPFASGPVVEETSWKPQAVQVDHDYRRVAALPRYEWQGDPQVPALVRALTDHLRVGSAGPDLRPEQAVVLRELWELGWCAAPLLPGAGKSLPGFLAATLLQEPRTVLVAPAALVKRKRGRPSKTERDAAKYSSWGYKIAPITMLSYEELSRDAPPPAKRTPGDGPKGGDEKLAYYAPRLLILDESHRVKSSKASAWRKIKRYVKAARKTGTKVRILFMSASMVTRGLGDYWHLMHLAAGEQAPMPLEFKSFLAWSWAMDEKVGEMNRLDPGPLLDLTPGCPSDLKEPIDRARWAYGQRLIQSRGVVASVGDRPAMALNIEVRKYPPAPAVKAAIDHMTDTMETPDGYVMQSQLEVYSRTLQLENGYYQIYDPPPPNSYREASKAWSTVYREVIKAYHTIDTPEAVANAVRSGRFEQFAPLLTEWEHQRKSTVLNTRAIWIDDSAIARAITWLEKEAGATGIVWCEHPIVAQAISDWTGLPYFHENGYAAGGAHIEKCKTSCVASIRANSTGINVHHHFDRSLHLDWSSVGGEVEQTLGRTHRTGQAADEVSAVIPIVTDAKASALVQSIRDARNIQLHSAVPQKLCFATWTGDFEPDTLEFT